MNRSLRVNWVCWMSHRNEYIELILVGISFCYSRKLNDFSVTMFKCFTNVNSFSPHTVRLFFPLEYFTWTYDLSGFKSRVKRRLSPFGIFLKRVCYVLSTFGICFSNNLPFSSCAALCGVNPN